MEVIVCGGRVEVIIQIASNSITWQAINKARKFFVYPFSFISEIVFPCIDFSIWIADKLNHEAQLSSKWARTKYRHIKRYLHVSELIALLTDIFNFASRHFLGICNPLRKEGLRWYYWAIVEIEECFESVSRHQRIYGKANILFTYSPLSCNQNRHFRILKDLVWWRNYSDVWFERIRVVQDTIVGLKATFEIAFKHPVEIRVWSCELRSYEDLKRTIFKSIRLWQWIIEKESQL